MAGRGKARQFNVRQPKETENMKSTQQVINIEITGTSPLLMHAFPLTPIEALEKMQPADQVKHHLYVRPDTSAIYVPGVNIQRSLIAAAAYSKGKGRGSLQKPVAACVLVTDEYVDVHPQSYVVDSRPVVIPATKGRVLRHRARFEKWTLDFTIEFDSTLLKESELRRVVDDAGSRVGLLDFRPERKGSFGRFVVTRWRAISEVARAA
jgi:hypothetical protein